MVDIINQFSNYSFSSNHNLYEGMIDVKTPVNNVITYYEPGDINDNPENQQTKNNTNNLNENAKNEDSTIKMNEITKDETMEQMPHLRIVNIVSMVDLGCDLNLREIL